MFPKIRLGTQKSDLIPPHPNPLPHWGRGDKERLPKSSLSPIGGGRTKQRLLKSSLSPQRGKRGQRKITQILPLAHWGRGDKERLLKSSLSPIGGGRTKQRLLKSSLPHWGRGDKERLPKSSLSLQRGKRGQRKITQILPLPPAGEEGTKKDYRNPPSRPLGERG